MEGTQAEEKRWGAANLVPRVTKRDPGNEVQSAANKAVIWHPQTRCPEKTQKINTEQKRQNTGIYRDIKPGNSVILELQWNPVNPTTNEPAKSGRINGVVVFKKQEVPV